ncbi:MAG: hypothetical protein CO108_18110 [Deltaproteobacteria bacterium CG_4_9_14_3_um_filter_63_12]|nr:MAG: hypothetical protein COW42_13395 [Deltaproteobacteria bacterium CG17_big_fil_post_rev_8_21_14_2_50_63_7]PJB38955.1 MAG: hypothetical protein CO108_18110 [Deltaproteobacteria bacterium CG_4_9_14_3_um_filter_63_12]
MSRTPYLVHHWAVGSRFSVPIPVGNVTDFTLEREERTGQLFCAWVEERNEGRSTVRWSRAPELYAAWRHPTSVAHFQGTVFAPEIKFAKDRVLLTYLTTPKHLAADALEGTCHLHWKRITGGPWSEDVVVRSDVRLKDAEEHFPYNHVRNTAKDFDGRVWALVSNRRFVEPTYSLYPMSAPERALNAPNPWEDDLIYTGIVASSADRAKLVWDRGSWHIVRRVFDEAKDSYCLEAIALDLSILRHDRNGDGQADVIDSITQIYDDELLYMLWAEADYRDLSKKVGTLVAVRNPNQRSGRVDPSAKHVFETSAELAWMRNDAESRLPLPQLEIVGRGHRIPIEAIWQASAPVANATRWQQHRPPSITIAVDCAAHNTARTWLTKGMVVAETSVCSNATSFEGIVEWRTGPVCDNWEGFAHVLGASYKVTIVSKQLLSTPTRHRTTTWVGKLRTHRIFANFTDRVPLTQGIRIPLVTYDPEQRILVVGIAEVVSFE